ncbi:MAG: transposase, partial [Luteolibacter sp.]
MPQDHPSRKPRFHTPPNWVSQESNFFITINCKNRGSDQLTKPDTSKGLLDSIRFYQETQKWWVSIVLLMPDHLHGIFWFNNNEGLGMQKTIRNWKRYTSRNFGIEWQRDFFDHRIRSEQDMADKWQYIR